MLRSINMAKLITVFGSTGNQGGSVVRAILNHPELSKQWKIRGITRNPNKPDAQAMIAKGVEMVQADLNSKDSIISAIKGSNAVFGVTNYWEKGTLEHEVAQGKNLADAAKEAGVDHLIWSSLPFVSKITEGKLHNLHHFDSKAMVEEYVNELGLKASFVLPAYFMSNIPGSIRPDPSGSHYSLAWLFHPDTQIPMLDVPRDFGKFVATCLAEPEKTIGKHTLAASGWFTPLDVCKAVENCTGKKCEFHEIPIEKFGGSKELFDNLMMIREYEYFGSVRWRGRALLGTPNGAGVAWLLAQHREQLGWRVVDQVTVFQLDCLEEDEDPDDRDEERFRPTLLFWVHDVNSG